jgi:hypothetical protein
MQAPVSGPKFFFYHHNPNPATYLAMGTEILDLSSANTPVIHVPANPSCSPKVFAGNLEENCVGFHRFEAVQVQGVPDTEHDEDLPQSAAILQTSDFRSGDLGADSALPSSDRGTPKPRDRSGSVSVPAPLPSSRVSHEGSSTTIAPDVVSSLIHGASQGSSVVDSPRSAAIDSAAASPVSARPSTRLQYGIHKP